LEAQVEAEAEQQAGLWIVEVQPEMGLPQNLEVEAQVEEEQAVGLLMVEAPLETELR